MSWNDYIGGYIENWTNPNTGLNVLNACEAGALISSTDGTLWAATAGFNLSSYEVTVATAKGVPEKISINEFANLADAFANYGVSRKKGGIRLNQEKYYVISFDGDRSVMYLKKKGGGACVARSDLAFIIATYDSHKKATVKDYANEVAVPQNVGQTNKSCESLQAFLLDNNL